MDIRQILQDYSVPTAPEGHHHRTPRFEQVDCPWCSPNSYKWRLGLAKNGRVARCWACGSHSIVEALVELTGQSWGKVKDLVKDLYLEIPEYEPRKTGRLKLPDKLGPLLPIHKQYLMDRKFDVDKIELLWGLKGIGLAAKYAWRIFIPVTYRGKIVSWTTRAISDDVDKRYINAPSEHEEISLKDVLFGIDLVKNAIIVTEGPFDAIRIGPGAVATFGLGYTKRQVNQMIQFPVRIVCFDNEPQAQEQAKALCNDLSVFPGMTMNLQIESGKDPGDADEAEIEEVRQRFLV